MQAAQVRKSSFVAHGEDSKRAYHPETHHSSSIHAGTSVQQVQALTTIVTAIGLEPYILSHCPICLFALETQQRSIIGVFACKPEAECQQMLQR